MTYIPHHFQCSVCGAPKREINHWFMAQTVPRQASFRPWDDNVAMQIGIEHLCGLECLLKWVAKKAEELNR